MEQTKIIMKKRLVIADQDKYSKGNEMVSLKDVNKEQIQQLSRQL
ncbi:hypothetical protein [Enterococcus sp. CWB-B31]|nr:hypothetical protein [Enterococcus sp. CWB-B31]